MEEDDQKERDPLGPVAPGKPGRGGCGGKVHRQVGCLLLGKLQREAPFARAALHRCRYLFHSPAQCANIFDFQNRESWSPVSVSCPSS
jgi:hypothetical protein